MAKFREPRLSDPTEECERSYAAIELQDLLRLSEIARSDLHSYIAGDRRSRAVFATKILCVALCQGATLHYLDGKTGVKDFDIYTFFAADGAKVYPCRRFVSYDFGPSKFGRHPEDAKYYAGRRVDVMGRSIMPPAGASAICSVRHYLREGPTSTARFFAQKAVIIIDPTEQRGEVVWP